MKKEGFDDIEWGEDFGAPHETAIANHYDLPVFITNYPTKIKPFYMQPNPDNEDTVLCADLIAPEGYGEIIGGSERINDLELLEQTVAWISGVEHVRETSPFPRLLNRLYP